MSDFFHSERLGGSGDSWREAQILAAQKRAEELNEAIADAAGKIVKLFTPKRKK